MRSDIDGKKLWLLFATFTVAIISLLYELLAATTSSYILGDSIKQFSLVIGLFLFSMGAGAWLSRYVVSPETSFVWLQILLGIAGGFLPMLVYFSYANSGIVHAPLFLTLGIVGILSGMEIPLIARILQAKSSLNFEFENVLSLDYLGALLASVSFPLLIIPNLSLVSAALLLGALNLFVAAGSIVLFRDLLSNGVKWAWFVATFVVVLAFVTSNKIVSNLEAKIYNDEIILSEQTPYQKLTLTKFRSRIRFYINDSIQFDSIDEYRYHEALVHPAMSIGAPKENVLIVGGGDGLALREVLKHDPKRAVLVDLDARVTEIFSTFPDLLNLNNSSLLRSNVQVINKDIWTYIEQENDFFDVIILDLPDPSSIGISRFYSLQFYKLLARNLSENGIIVTQASSPLFATEAFWSIHDTLASVPNSHSLGENLATIPYHIYLPSFGEWGFVLAQNNVSQKDPRFLESLRFLDSSVWRNSQEFSKDMSKLDVEINTLSSHPLVRYYIDGWSEWFE